jgi:CarboxypepD_reg-like domain
LFELSLAGMKYLLAFLLLFFIGDAIAQPSNYIKGKIVNGETGTVISNASVFITNTSKGTVSNNQGEFELTNAPVGTYDLVVSCIGYETQVYTYKASQLPLRLQMQMKPKADELQAVIIEPYEKDGWEKWGKFFTENFIGTSGNAGKCSIKNYKVLHFRNSKKKNTLTVTAAEPLIIENKALGYTIKYQLEGFSYHFKEHTLFYFGYSLFNELNGKTPRAKQLKNRETAYNGSVMHFMRSLYNNRLSEDGFELTRTIKIANIEKERVKKIYSEKPAGLSKDSTGYYDRILGQHDSLEVYLHPTADSLITPADAVTKKIFFDYSLSVMYKKGKEDPAYLEHTHENRFPYYQRSTIFLLNGNAVMIDQLGNYYMPQDLMSYGYWAWSEKISSMLPLDYKE